LEAAFFVVAVLVVDVAVFVVSFDFAFLADFVAATERSLSVEVTIDQWLARSVTRAG